MAERGRILIVRRALLFAILSVTATAQAQITRCFDNQPNRVTATVNGAAPVVIQLRYGVISPNRHTEPIVTRDGNIINVVSESHNPTIGITPPIECVTLQTQITGLEPGTYSVNWKLLAYIEEACGSLTCPVLESAELTFTTQFTVTEPVVGVATLSPWMLIGIAVACAIAGWLTLSRSVAVA